MYSSSEVLRPAVRQRAALELDHDHYRWQSVSSVRWHSRVCALEDRARRRRYVEKIKRDDRTPANIRNAHSIPRSVALRFEAMYERHKICALKSISDLLAREIRATCTRRVEAPEGDTRPPPPNMKNALKRIASSGQLSVACMSVFVHAEKHRYAEYARALAAIFAAVYRAIGDTEFVVKCASERHACVFIKEEVDDRSWAAYALDGEAVPSGLSDDSDDDVAPVFIAEAAVAGGGLACEGAADAYTLSEIDSFKMDCGELMNIADQLATAAAFNDMYAGVFGDVSLLYRRHEHRPCEPDVEHGLVVNMERAFSPHLANVAHGCSYQGDGSWPHAARSMNMYTFCSETGGIACATLDACCGAVRISSTLELKRTIGAISHAAGAARRRGRGGGDGQPQPQSPSPHVSSAYCWNLLWKSGVGSTVFPGQAEGVCAAFTERRSGGEATSPRKSITAAASRSVLMHLCGTDAAGDSIVQGSRVAYIQHQCALYFVMSPSLRKECRNWILDDSADARFAAMQPQAFLKVITPTGVSDDEGRDEATRCPDHAPHFSSRMYLNDKDATAAAYIGMRTLASLDRDAAHYEYEYGEDSWVLKWLRGCEVPTFCTCGMDREAFVLAIMRGQEARDDPSAQSGGARPRGAPPEHVTFQVWANVLSARELDAMRKQEAHSATPRANDPASSNCRDDNGDDEDSDSESEDYWFFREADAAGQSVVPALYDAMSKVYETLNVTLDRSSRFAENSDQGYAIVINGVRYGTLNARVGVTYKVMYKENPAVMADFCVWTEIGGRGVVLGAERGVHIASKKLSGSVVWAELMLATPALDLCKRKNVTLYYGLRRNFTVFGEMGVSGAEEEVDVVTVTPCLALPAKLMASVGSSAPRSMSRDRPAEVSSESSSEYQQEVASAASSSNGRASSDDDVFKRREPVVQQDVGIILLYTPVTAMSKFVQGNVYRKQMPALSSMDLPRVWFFAPVKGDAGRIDCSHCVGGGAGSSSATAALKQRTGVSKFSVEFGATYCMAVVLDPAAGVDVEEVYCPELRLRMNCGSGEAQQSFRIPPLSAANDVTWSRSMSIASAGAQIFDVDTNAVVFDIANGGSAAAHARK